jgi:RNA polymerase sigma-70 factor, ECF subfamily
MTAWDEVDGFEVLYRETRAAVLAYLLRRVATREDAADLLAEVYTVAWRRRADRPRGSEARPWLFGVARRVLAEHARGEVRRRAAADGLRALLAHPSAGDGTPDDIDEQHRHAWLRGALASLGPIDRELIALTVWEGLTPAQAAEALGISSGSARVRLHRARNHLRRHGPIESLDAPPPHAARRTSVS